MAYLLLSVLALLASCSSGATLHAEKDSRTMRRETGSHSVKLTPSGEVVQSVDPVHSFTENFCNFVFEMGTPGTNVCTDPVNHHNITSTSLCMDAANITGAAWGHVIGVHEQTTHPKACFKNEDTNTFYYNEVELVPGPTGLSGTPVCSRPKYVPGKVDGQGCGTGTAGDFVFDNYEVIMKEHNCAVAISCDQKPMAQINYMTGEHNASKKPEHPMGCWFDEVPVEKWGYFNAGFPEGVTGMGEPAHTKGTPICLSKASTWYGGDHSLAGVSA